MINDPNLALNSEISLKDFRVQLANANITKESRLSCVLLVCLFHCAALLIALRCLLHCVAYCTALLIAHTRRQQSAPSINVIIVPLTGNLCCILFCGKKAKVP